MEELLAANGRLPPGFGFSPTDIELVVHYLKRKLNRKQLEPELVAEVDINQFHPKDLREKAGILSKNPELYFFCPVLKKYSFGDKRQRSSELGFWKGSGQTRDISYLNRIVGDIRTFVFYEGKQPEGKRTNWVMHEYTLKDAELDNKEISVDAFVLCKVFKKRDEAYNEDEWNEGETSSNAVSGAVSVTPGSDEIMISGPLSADPYLLEPPEQVYSDAMSVSAGYQAFAMPDSNEIMISGSVSANPYILEPPEQVYSDPMSVSAAYQAPTLTSGGANVASTSKGPGPDFDEGVPKTDEDCYGGVFAGLKDLSGIKMDDLLTPLGPQSEG